MRVQTGSAKGRKLKSPSGSNIRPTTGRVKKSIFDKLGDIKGRNVLDLFAGTGSLGIEALSRDVARVVFVEKERSAVNTISENIEKCGFRAKARILSTDYKKAIRILQEHSERFNLVFIDPPYEVYKKKCPSDFVKELHGLLVTPWEIVVEHDKVYNFEDSGNYIETRHYGSTQVSYFRND